MAETEPAGACLQVLDGVAEVEPQFVRTRAKNGVWRREGGACQPQDCSTNHEEARAGLVQE